MTKDALRRRAQQLKDEVRAKTADVEAGRITKDTYASFVDRTYREYEDIQTQLKSFSDAIARFGGAADLTTGGRTASAAQLPGGVSDRQGWVRPPSVLDVTDQQLQALMMATKARTPLTIQVGAEEPAIEDQWAGTTKTYSWRDQVGVKSPTLESGLSGGFTGNLPPVMSLKAVAMPYEPTRIAEWLPGMPRAPPRGGPPAPEPGLACAPRPRWSARAATRARSPRQPRRGVPARPVRKPAHSGPRHRPGELPGVAG